MIRAYHCTASRRVDPLDIHVRLIHLVDQIEIVKAEFSPVTIRPFCVAQAIINTAIQLENINFEVMESVVASLREGVQMFALYSASGSAALYLMDLSEDILADLPIPHTPLQER